jgi:hypothetical protein
MKRYMKTEVERAAVGDKSNIPKSSRTKEIASDTGCSHGAAI